MGLSIRNHYHNVGGTRMQKRAVIGRVPSAPVAQPPAMSWLDVSAHPCVV